MTKTKNTRSLSHLEMIQNKEQKVRRSKCPYATAFCFRRTATEFLGRFAAVRKLLFTAYQISYCGKYPLPVAISVDSRASDEFRRFPNEVSSNSSRFFVFKDQCDSRTTTKDQRNSNSVRSFQTKPTFSRKHPSVSLKNSEKVTPSRSNGH